MGGRPVLVVVWWFPVALAWMASDWPISSCKCRFRTLYERDPALYAVGHPRECEDRPSHRNIPSQLLDDALEGTAGWRTYGGMRAARWQLGGARSGEYYTSNIALQTAGAGGAR
ncbi:hypothetical protein BDV96DRAFT_351532 [Lophiotrema nucula]|uniref:Uncharacterized protein n=1 Tax=Lophiotrema nucula TaxID=690887 RepID=A0A6A5ZLJ3_9PLEO|nr:hypothetical protein BDV96DRAFT_351532 [Lophiotrema nucula]